MANLTGIVGNGFWLKLLENSSVKDEFSAVANNATTALNMTDYTVLY